MDNLLTALVGLSTGEKKVEMALKGKDTLKVAPDFCDEALGKIGIIIIGFAIRLDNLMRLILEIGVSGRDRRSLASVKIFPSSLPIPFSENDFGGRVTCIQGRLVYNRIMSMSRQE